MESPIITMLGGTCCVPSAVFSIENTIVNLKKLVIQLKTNGNSENTVITINICITGFIFCVKLSIFLSDNFILKVIHSIYLQFPSSLAFYLFLFFVNLKPQQIRRQYILHHKWCLNPLSFQVLALKMF